MFPLPSLRFPFQTASALRVGMVWAPLFVDRQDLARRGQVLSNERDCDMGILPMRGSRGARAGSPCRACHGMSTSARSRLRFGSSVEATDGMRVSDESVAPAVAPVTETLLNVDVLSVAVFFEQTASPM